MLSRIFLAFILVKIGCAQIDGEFWWLNDKFANYVGTRPPAPLFENLSEFDNDENAKIIFRDESFQNDNSKTIENSNSNKHVEKKTSLRISEHKIRWPSKNTIFNSSNNLQHLIEDQIRSAGNKLIFKFPEDDSTSTWKKSIEDDSASTLKKLMNVTTEAPLAPVTESNLKLNVSKNNTVFYNVKVPFAWYYNERFSENICTYMNKSDCYDKKGVVRHDWKNEKKETINAHLICCILPLKTINEKVSQKITFPDNPKLYRIRRSKDAAQSQRNILLLNNYPRQNYNKKPAAQVLYDDIYQYEDPYTNIKNDKSKETNVRYEYSNDDYQDYAAEIPTPGLTGFYSEVNENKDSVFGGEMYYDDEDDTDLGYSTIDPRIGKNKNRKSKRPRPTKTTASYEVYDLESQTISYQSDPNFNIFQDFKLPNLNRKKGLKVPRSTTTHTLTTNAGKDITINEDVDENSDITNNEFSNRQVYKRCGKSAKPLITTSKQIGDAPKGSHPWLALLVPTHKQNRLLCYASLIHPRAAVTAGDCVHSTAPGDITLIAGIWNLNERSLSGRRVVIPLLHPKYKSGDLNNNLAMLHWKRSLKLGMNIQPICLAKPSFYHECVFVGWGGFDQAIRSRSRWQRTTVHNCKDHTSLLGIDIPHEAFCASVKSRSTVTGIGGSLVCRIEGHLSAVGVAVSRDSTLILLPMYDWVTSPSIDSFIDVSEE